MSFEAAAWAIKLVPDECGISPTEKSILIHMCDCHNASNHKCFPSLSFLANRTGYAKSTVQTAIDRMEEMGLFARFTTGKGRSTVYLINFGWGVPTTGTPEIECSESHASQGVDDSQSEGVPTTGTPTPSVPTIGTGVYRPSVRGVPTIGTKPVINHNQEGNDKKSFSNSRSRSESKTDGRPLLDTTRLIESPETEIAGLEKTISMLPKDSHLRTHLQAQVDRLNERTPEEVT